MKSRLRINELILAVSLAALLASPAETWAQKPKPGGGSTTPVYSLTDLLGFGSNNYQSRAEFVLNRMPTGEATFEIEVHGTSRIVSTTGSSFHPARWRVDETGDFSA
ncbi:MAG TPA: hypothetical protein VJ417_07355, partial [Candidatus Glassbacteria bacterium]|nr:hypothetical protein [Candidatus Glassbacteria bacterium]